MTVELLPAAAELAQAQAVDGTMPSTVGNVLAGVSNRMSTASTGKHGRVARLELRHLRLFYEASRSGSLSIAATALRLSQPSATRLMNELEEAFGETLTIRGPGGTKLTEQGEAVLSLVEEVLDRVDCYFIAADFRKQSAAPRIVVGNTGSRFVSTAILKFSRKVPSCDITVLEGPFEFLYTLLHQDEIDVVVGPLAGETSGCICLPTYSAAISFLVGAQHPLASKGDVTWADMGRFRWIIPRRGTTFRRWFDADLEQHNVAIPRGSIQSASQSLNGTLLFESNMIMAFPTHFNEALVRNGLIKVLNLKQSLTQHPYGIIYKDGRASDSVIAAFANCFRACVDESVTPTEIV